MLNLYVNLVCMSDETAPIKYFPPLGSFYKLQIHHHQHHHWSVLTPHGPSYLVTLFDGDSCIFLYMCVDNNSVSLIHAHVAWITHMYLIERMQLQSFHLSYDII